MITLQKEENIEVYECFLKLKKQDKQNPLISVLILARELEEKEEFITPEILQKVLFQIFPLQYCENILNQFKNDGYFTEDEIEKVTFYNNHDGVINLDRNHKEFIKVGFKLTVLGNESAESKIIWKEKQGVYTISINNSKIINEKIIDIKAIDKNKDLDKNATDNLPHHISQINDYSLENGTKIISEVTSGFKKETKKSTLKVEIDQNTIRKKIDDFKFEKNENLEIENEKEILCKFLEENEFEFDVINNDVKILTKFDENNFSFQRKVTLKNINFKNTKFDDLAIELKHLPNDNENAQKWFTAIVINDIQDYFIDNQSFQEYAITKTIDFENRYKLKILSKKTILDILKTRENSFYKIAKLETINYLNY